MSKRELPQTDLPIKDGERPQDLFSDDDDDSDDYEDESDEDIVQASGSEDDGEFDDDDDGAALGQQQVWLPGTQLAKDEVLEPDMTAYEVLHNVTAKWPCLTFDILWDRLGEDRRTYPATAYFVAGTQADTPKHNEIQVVKLSNLSRTARGDDESVASDESDDEAEGEPSLDYRAIPLSAGVNRIRATQQRDLPRHVCALTEDGVASIYDIEAQIASLDTPSGTTLAKAKPLHTIRSADEGYAVDWSTTTAGRLVTGDNSGRIRLTQLAESRFATDDRPFTGHKSSVEDLGWSPSERTVFSSCSSDRTVRIWDTRSKKRAPAITYTAHDADVNVLSWNTNVSYLLATGADDGRFSVWDLRALGDAPKPVASFDWHKGAVTSIGWHPQDESVLAVSGADDQTTIWDLSVELDAEEQAAKQAEGLGDVPSQLMFCHMGQQDVKELRWHPQLPGTLITTAASGFNLFKSAHQN